MWKSDIRPPRCSRWMMNVGLEISVGSIPRPEAIPRARTVLPAPSSPQSANTSFGRADRPRRSPRRSVWSEEWLTRSTETTSRRAATRRSAVVFAALKDDPDGNAEERSEERGPYREKPLARDRAEEVDAGVAAKRADERDEPERSDQTLPSHQRALLGLIVRPALPFGARDALLAPAWCGLRCALPPLAPPSPPCHRARLAVGGDGPDGRLRGRLPPPPNDPDPGVAPRPSPSPGRRGRSGDRRAPPRRAR